MHMADALISPVIGGIMLAAATGTGAYSIKNIHTDLDGRKIPMMGVMGAFVFAAQMINFSIPGTGSSGHIGGGMLLAALLGPYEGFLTMAAILLIQSLFFADGGLLAYGCNVFNLGFYACFIAYPLVFKWFTRKGFTARRLLTASLISSVVALQLGAFSVVLETVLSGKTGLPFGAFVLMMQPIHLAIAVVEGIVTAAVLIFVWRARPEILERNSAGLAFGDISLRKVISGLLIAAVLLGGILSWFASSNPDGLEWSMIKVAGTSEFKASGEYHKSAADLQGRTAFLPDYGFGDDKTGSATAGTSVSGLAGGALTLALAVLTGLAIRFVKRRIKSREGT